MDGLLAWMPLLSLAGHAFFLFVVSRHGQNRNEPRIEHGINTDNETVRKPFIYVLSHIARTREKGRNTNETLIETNCVLSRAGPLAQVATVQSLVAPSPAIHDVKRPKSSSTIGVD